MSLFDKPPCESCKLLREIVEYEREQKRELVELLTSLLKPQVIIQPEVQPRQIQPKHQLWSKRKAELERADREAAALIVKSPIAAKSDSVINDKSNEITQLEMELGISETEH